jgi:4-hydroxy-tetrahydrodipicolinate reductase
MSTIKVMVNGLPGNVTQMIASHIARDEALTLLPYSLTGPEIDIDRIAIENIDIELIRPDRRDASIMTIKDSYDSFISVDFTHPSAVNRNARFYCTHGLPFVMGTTGGDRQDLHETVTKSPISAVIAPNMARQIVGLQAMLAYGAENFPGLFQGYTLTVHESHQQGKADTSGTAKAMVGYFNAMGVDFTNDQIQKERDPAIQKQQWGIPEAYLDGHVRIEAQYQWSGNLCRRNAESGQLSAPQSPGWQPRPYLQHGRRSEDGLTKMVMRNTPMVLGRTITSPRGEMQWPFSIGARQAGQSVVSR